MALYYVQLFLDTQPDLLVTNTPWSWGYAAYNISYYKCYSLKRVGRTTNMIYTNVEILVTKPYKYEYVTPFKMAKPISGTLRLLKLKAKPLLIQTHVDI